MFSQTDVWTRRCDRCLTALLLDWVFHHQSGQATIRQTMLEEGIRLALLQVNNVEVDKSHNSNFKEAEATKVRYCYINDYIRHLSWTSRF